MKIRNTIIFLLSPFLYLIGQSDTVDYTIIGNESSEYSTDLDTLSGFIYLVGNSNECGSNDGFILKYKEDSVYNRTIIGSESIEIIESIETTSLDSIYIAGYTNLNNDYDVYLAKLDTQLNIIKTKTIEVPDWNFCHDIAMANNSIVGVGETHNGSDYDAFIFKTDNNLDTLWTRSFVKTNDQKLSKVVAYNDSIFIACGYTEIDGLAKDILLVSFNINTGDTLWTNHYGGVNDDFCSSLIKTNDGGIAGFGTTSSYVSTSEDYMLFKTNNLGVFEWSRLHYTQTGIGNYNDRGIDLVQLQNGNFIVASFTESYGGPGVKSTMIMITDNIGVWQNGYIHDGGHDDIPTAIVKTNDTTFYISGIANSTTFGYSDLYVIKMSSVAVSNTTNINSKYIDRFCLTDLIEKTKKELSLFPNPINAFFTISSKTNSNVEVTVFDLLGNIVFELNTPIDNKVYMPEKIKNGNYIVRLKQGDNSVHKKVVLIR